MSSRNADTVEEPKGDRPAPALPMLANSVALVAGKLATLGLGFLAWIVSARLFDQAEVGLASGIVSAMMLCVQLALFGAGAAVITLFPDHRARPEELLNTSVTVVALSALVAAGGFLAIAAQFLNELKIVGQDASYAALFLIMCVAGTVGVLIDQISTAQRRGDQALLRGVSTGGATLALIGLLAWLFDANSALAILLAWMIGSVFSVAVAYIQIRRSTGGYRYRPRVRRQLALQLTRIGLPNWLLTLSERTPGAILPIFVTELLSPDANAAWYAAWMMAWVVYVIPIQVGLNAFAEAAHRLNSLKSVIRQGVLTSMTIGLVAAVCTALVGPMLLGALGSGYAEDGTTPLRILLLVVFPFTVIQAYFAACRALQKFQEAIVTGVLSAAAGIGFAAMMGPRYGLTGMACAWLAVQTLTSIWSAFRLFDLTARPESSSQKVTSALEACGAG